jgi:uncharacterized protein
MQTTPPEASQGSRARNGSALRRTFHGAQGLRAGCWSVLLFLAIYQLFETAAMTALGHFVSLKPKGSIPPGLALIRESCEVLVVLSATSLMARIEKRRPLSFGYIGDRKIIRLLSGTIWGFVCLSILVGVLCKTGFMVIDDGHWVASVPGNTLLHGVWSFYWLVSSRNRCCVAISSTCL